MKKAYILLVCMLLASFSMFAQLSNGLIARWAFNGNTADSAGTHHGNANNITYGPGRAGQANTAAIFNGTSSFVSTAYQSDLNVTKYTICALVKPTGFYTALCQGNRILSRGNDFSQGYYQLEMFDNAYDSLCTVTGDTNHFTFGTAIKNQTMHMANLYYTPTVHTQNWYCVVATWNDTAFKLYVDGVMKINAAPYSKGIIGTSTDSLVLGAHKFAQFAQYPYWFSGYMDEVRLYNRALTQTEADSFCLLNSVPSSTAYVTLLEHTSLCAGDTIHVSFGVTSPFSSGNTFTLELSDSGGNFTSPVTIGSISDTTSGTIVGTIPAGTLSGTGYKVRIVASSPSYISIPYSVSITIGNIPANVTATSNSPINKNTALLLYGNTTTANCTYSWTGPNSFASALQNPSIASAQLVNTGMYIVIVSNYGCTAQDTTFVTVRNIDGIDNSAANTLSSLQLYPNPNKGSFTISGNIADAVQIEVLNTMGQVIYSNNYTPVSGSINTKVNIGAVSSGVYYVRLRTGENTSTLKMLVQ